MKKILNSIGKWFFVGIVILTLAAMAYWNAGDKQKVDRLRAEMFQAYEIAQAKADEVNKAKLELPQKFCLEDPTYCAPAFPQAKNLN